MGLHVAIQMDPPAGLNPADDSTLALALEAQARGHTLYYYHAGELSHRHGSVWAPLRPVRFFDQSREWFREDAPEPTDLRHVDVVLMRQDPPYDMAYLTATYLLDQITAETLVVNHPAAVRNAPEKLSILQFPDYIPPGCITRDIATIDAFRREHGAIIVKPLYGYGGHEVYYFTPEDSNCPVVLEHYLGLSPLPLIVQRFLPEVSEQDRRVILIDGKIAGAIGRIPLAGHIRSNMRVGGQAVAAELSARQRTICEAVGAVIAREGILLAGLDLIGEYLTEINVTSPTGLRAVAATSEHRPAAAFWDAVNRKVPSPSP